MIHSMIKSGEELLDTGGRKVEAHAGAILYEDGRYWLYGEDKSHTDGKNKIWTWGVHCYSSTDLMNWRDEGLIIPPETQDPQSWLHPGRHLDRPHIVHCQATGKYVCWLKYSGTTEACFGVLTAERLLGPYAFVRTAFRPFGKEVGDFDLLEEEGQTYLYFTEGHSGIVACRLTEDCTDVQPGYVRYYEHLTVPYVREGVALVRHAGRRYLFTSGMTGYISNPTEVALLDEPMGKITVLGNPHVGDPSGASFRSQISTIIPIHGRDNVYLVLADRWIPSLSMNARKTEKMMRALAACMSRDYRATLMEKARLAFLPWNCDKVNTSLSRYVWLPMTFEDGMPVIQWQDSWSPETWSRKGKSEQ